MNGIVLNRPVNWAVAKGLVSLTREGNLVIVDPLPTAYVVARALEKWPSAAADPDFAISEEAFDAAIERAKGF